MNTIRKVLVIDDDETFRNILKDSFKEEGFTVLEAKNGDDGLEVAMREHPDLITLDIDMPKKGGFGVLKVLRSDNWGKKVHVIMISNFDDLKLVSEALGQATYDFVVKSDWPIQKVVDLVKSRLSTLDSAES